MQGTAEKIQNIIAEHKNTEGALLPILHAIQNEIGYIPDECIQPLADGLNLTRADVHGVISFYHDFRRHKPGKHILKLCRAEACQSMGGRELSDAVMRQLGLQWHETTADGTVTLEPVFCLGLCSNPPAGMLDSRPLAALNEDKARRLIAGVRL